MGHLKSGQAFWPAAVFRVSRGRAFFAALVITAPAALAQTAPSRLQGPPSIELRQAPSEADELDRERFRRQAAEAAQKQLERLAEQLRERLAAEVAARISVESKLTDLTARIVVSDQIDTERQRLRDSKLGALEAQRDALERNVAELTRRLAGETTRRRELEVERDEASRQPPKTVAIEAQVVEKLNGRVKDLERRLTAAEWARKLAEAQLKLISQRQEAR